MIVTVREVAAITDVNKLPLHVIDALCLAFFGHSATEHFHAKVQLAADQIKLEKYEKAAAAAREEQHRRDLKESERVRVVEAKKRARYTVLQLLKDRAEAAFVELTGPGRGVEKWISSPHSTELLGHWNANYLASLRNPEEIAACCERHFGGYNPPSDCLGWLLSTAVLAESLPIAFTVSDPSIAGFPLIFVNEKFCEVTGYSKEDSYGRNCRFLQGPGTNPEHGQKLKDDLRDGSVSQTMLLNYRKTGEPFENLLTMRYIHDSLGRRRYCVGLQLDLTGKSSESGPWSQQMLATEEGRKLIAEASQKMLKLITMIPKVLEVPAPPTPEIVQHEQLKLLNLQPEARRCAGLDQLIGSLRVLGLQILPPPTPPYPSTAPCASRH
jgi:PAS domain S-box-containing protein